MPDAPSTPTRPKPRPRPRAVPKKTTDVEQGTSSAPQNNANQASSSGSQPQPTQDLDSMFIINRQRTAKDWKRLEKEAEKARAQNGDDDNPWNDGVDDFDDIPTPRKRARMHEGARPRWETEEVYANILKKAQFQVDSDVEFDESNGSEAASDDKRKGKRKRSPSRSRSRSLSPAPALSAQQLLAVKTQLWRTHPAPAPRAPSPTIELPDPTASLDLAPELREILNKTAERASEHHEPLLVADETVMVTVRWQPHPLDTEAPEESNCYKLTRAEPLKVLFEAVAEDFMVLEEDLRLLYRGRRIFPSITPLGIKMFAKDEDVVACDQQTFDYIKQNPDSVQTVAFDFAFTQSQPRAHATPPPQPLASSSKTTLDTLELTDSSPEPENLPSAAPPQPAESGDDSDVEIVPQTQTQEIIQTQTQTQSQSRHEGADEDAGPTFKLVVRSARTTKDITLTVRPTTKCGAIVKAFIKKAKLEDEFSELFVDPAAAPPAPVEPEPEPEPAPARGRGRGGKRGRGARGRGRGRGRGKGKAAAAELPPPPEPAAPAHSGKDPRVCIDGDKMDNDTPISEADLDDGDVIDVVGL